MKEFNNVRRLILGLLTLVIVSVGNAQTIDKDKLDQLFDRLLEKNKGMGSIVVAKAKEGRIYPVADIVAAVFDIYWNKPYQVPTLFIH